MCLAFVLLLVTDNLTNFIMFVEGVWLTAVICGGIGALFGLPIVLWNRYRAARRARRPRTTVWRP